jgi:hypothetical protein
MPRFMLSVPPSLTTREAWSTLYAHARVQPSLSTRAARLRSRNDMLRASTELPVETEQSFAFVLIEYETLADIVRRRVSDNGFLYLPLCSPS